MVHRDLKPSNVILGQSGPTVVDFGIAQTLDATSVTKMGMMVGSAGFMAPEQVTGRAGRADPPVLSVPVLGAPIAKCGGPTH